MSLFHRLNIRIGVSLAGSPVGPGPGHHDHGDHPPHPPNGSHPAHPNATDNLTWLRGIAQTNEEGIAEFTTVVPGWYPGRAAHIHIKVTFQDDHDTLVIRRA